MGLKPAGMADAATVITMYDPARLQVRADVRLEDVPRVRKGQPVQIATPAVRQPLLGHVIATTSFTDIQKNTVQVKVSIDDPPEVLKPDMLVEVTFLSPATASAPKSGRSAPLRLVIPAELPEEENGQSFVWVADPSERVARRKAIQVGGLTPQGSREITGGLSLGDRVIRNPPAALQPGTPIEIHEEVGSPTRERGPNAVLPRLRVGPDDARASH
jgi:multidrug efflux pump subunit AcrA (membrane-fusion protein)